MWHIGGINCKYCFFFFQAEDGIRDKLVTGVQTCALPITGTTAPPGTAPPGTALGDVGSRTVPFRGPRQAGIATPARPQARVWLAGFDLAPEVDPAALRSLLRRWTEAGAKLTAGQP